MLTQTQHTCIYIKYKQANTHMHTGHSSHMHTCLHKRNIHAFISNTNRQTHTYIQDTLHTCMHAYKPLYKYTHRKTLWKPTHTYMSTHIHTYIQATLLTSLLTGFIRRMGGERGKTFALTLQVLPLQHEPATHMLVLLCVCMYDVTYCLGCICMCDVEYRVHPQIFECLFFNIQARMCAYMHACMHHS